jgi:hypothetical protein
MGGYSVSFLANDNAHALYGNLLFFCTVSGKKE